MLFQVFPATSKPLDGRPRPRRGENLQCVFSLTLCTIGMDGGAGETAVVEKVVQEIGGFLVRYEDDRTGRWHGQQQIEDAVTLLCVVHEENLHQQYR